MPEQNPSYERPTMNFPPFQELEVLKRLSAIEQKLTQLTEQGETTMATLDSFISDVTKYQTDVQAALARAQTDLDTLKAALANAGLNTAQQAALDAADASVNAADTTAGGFDVTAATPPATVAANPVPVPIPPPAAPVA